jgi:hypothetical protein
MKTMLLLFFKGSSDDAMTLCRLVERKNGLNFKATNDVDMWQWMLLKRKSTVDHRFSLNPTNIEENSNTMLLNRVR